VAVDLHREALVGLRRAAIWYEEQRSGLGDEFVDRIRATLERVGDHPSEYPIWPGTEGSPTPIRRALVERFPYAIAVEIQPDVLSSSRLRMRSGARFTGCTALAPAPPNKGIAADERGSS
jgi:hypothetical protein